MKNLLQRVKYGILKVLSESAREVQENGEVEAHAHRVVHWVVWGCAFRRKLHVRPLGGFRRAATSPWGRGDSPHEAHHIFHQISKTTGRLHFKLNTPWETLKLLMFHLTRSRAFAPPSGTQRLRRVPPWHFLLVIKDPVLRT